jgi:hypothetical protein
MLLQTLTFILRVARITEPTKYLRRAKVKKKYTKVLLWNQKNKEAQGEKKRDMKGKQNHNEDSSLGSMQEKPNS